MKKIFAVTMAIVLLFSMMIPCVAVYPVSGDTARWNGHTYKRIEIPMTWTAARAYCEKLGGYLATVTSLEEQTILMRLVKTGEMGVYWLGATDEETEGDWKWITGEEWGFRYSGGFDNFNGVEDYLQMYRHRNSDYNYLGFWNDCPNDNFVAGEEDFYNTENVGFICEFGDYTVADGLVYEIEGKTASCNEHTYTLIEKAMTWQEAKEYCEKNGGYLATITSEKEQKIVVDLMQKAGKSKQAYWLGATDEETEGEWKWITGESWYYTPSQWNFDDAHGGEDYLQIQREPRRQDVTIGYWNDVKANNVTIAGEQDYYNSDNVGFIMETGDGSPFALEEYIVDGNTLTWNGHTYTMVEESMTWHEAKEYAERQGGYLATITSKNEQKAVKALISHGQRKNMYWLGATDEDEEGTWKWVTGEKWGYIPDSAGFDNAWGGEDYLQIQRANFGYWNDAKNDNTTVESEKWLYYSDNTALIIETGDLFPDETTEVKGSTPIIYIIGRTGIVTADGGSASVENTGVILDCVKQCLPEMEDAILKMDWDPFCDKLYELIADKFKDYALNNDGEVDNGSHNTWSYSANALPAQQGDIFTYRFEYDARRDPCAIADDLHKYINAVKARTGHDKIHLISRCLGCNIAAAYLAEYGWADIETNVFFASAAMGYDFVGEMFAGEFDFDGNAISRYADETLSLSSDELTELANAAIALADRNGLLDLETDVGMMIYEAVSEKITPRLLRATYGTSPGYWAMVNDENYEDAKEYMLGDEADTTYAKLVEKIDNYHYNVQQKLPDILKQMQTDGVKMNIICKYGFQVTPFIKDADAIGDNRIEVSKQSFGATTTDIDKTFSWLYLRKAKKNGTIDYISPDQQIDSSTALFPDSTWYIKNIVHNPFYDCFNALMLEMCYSDGQLTVWDDDTWPQYLYYDDEISDCVPLDMGNMNQYDYTKNLFEAIGRLFMAWINYLKLLTAKSA